MKKLFIKKSEKSQRRRFKPSGPSPFETLLPNDVPPDDSSQEQTEEQISEKSLFAPELDNLSEISEPDTVLSQETSSAGIQDEITEDHEPDIEIIDSPLSALKSEAEHDIADSLVSSVVEVKDDPDPESEAQQQIAPSSKDTINEDFTKISVRRKIIKKKTPVPKQFFESILHLFKVKSGFKNAVLNSTKRHSYKPTQQFRYILYGAGAVILAVIFLLIFVKDPSSTSAAVKDGLVVAVTSSPSADGTQGASTTEPLTPSPTPDPTLKPGDTSPAVATLQQRLMDLDYMNADEPTEYYGPQTELAVQLFQRKHNLAIDGIAGPQTLALINSNDAQVYTVSVGISGTDVKELQSRLVELGYLDKASNDYTESTAAAVKQFQTRNGLTVDGTIGPDTLEKLYSDDVKPFSVSSGMTGDAVTNLQKRLKKLGYLSNADGTFGDETVQAVKRFQENNGLIDDGYVGPETKAALFSSSAQANALVIGMSGADVQKVQDQLIKLKYMKNSTGYYGEDTENAIQRFQKQNGLTVDGKVGSQTMNTLFLSSAKAAPSDSSGNNGSSGGSGGKNNGGTSPSDKSSLEKFISIAESKLGCKYVRGAKGPNSFDCSGFAYWCLNQAGVRQGYLTSYAWRSCTRYKKITSMGDIKRGDIIIYKMGASKGHVAIALSGSTMIDASSGNGKVVQRSFASSYWKGVFYCAYRIF